MSVYHGVRGMRQRRASVLARPHRCRWQLVGDGCRRRTVREARANESVMKGSLGVSTRVRSAAGEDGVREMMEDGR